MISQPTTLNNRWTISLWHHLMYTPKCTPTKNIVPSPPRRTQPILRKMTTRIKFTHRIATKTRNKIKIIKKNVKKTLKKHAGKIWAHANLGVG